MFRGKSGRDHEIAVTDQRLARLVKRCQDLPGQHLFQYVDDDGDRHPLTFTDVNGYLRTAAPDVTAKDIRTWMATLFTASTLAEFRAPESERAARGSVNQVIEAVSAHLGNTPAVCRASYVHPLVIEAFTNGTLARRWARGPSRDTRWLIAEERRLAALLRARQTRSAKREARSTGRKAS